MECVCAVRQQQQQQQAVSLRYMQMHFSTRPEVLEGSGLLECDFVCPTFRRIK